MREMDRQYLATPFYGSRRMKVWLERQGKQVSRKRVQRLMRVMGLRAIHRRPRTSRPAPGVRVYPYLLGKVEVTRPNQVWAADITYLPMARGFLYLKAYASAGEARRELGAYFRFYNDQRPHQALGYRTPGEVFSEGREPQNEESTVGRWSPEADVVSYAGAAGPSLNSALILSN